MYNLSLFTNEEIASQRWEEIYIRVHISLNSRTAVLSTIQFSHLNSGLCEDRGLC